MSYTSNQNKRRAVKLSGGRCLVCREVKDPEQLTFHHVFPDSKEYRVGHLLSRRWTDKTERELDKCIPVCLDCHMKLHGVVPNTRKRFNTPRFCYDVEEE